MKNDALMCAESGLTYDADVSGSQLLSRMQSLVVSKGHTCVEIVERDAQTVNRR